MINKNEILELNASKSFPGTLIFQHRELNHYLNEIKNLVSCPEALFKSLYTETLYRLAELCQSMALSKDHSAEYSLLKRQLDLCIGSLKLKRGLFLPKGSTAEKVAIEEPQWTYAIFTAAILKDIFHVGYDREVILFHQNKEPAGVWHVMAGSLYEENINFKVIYQLNRNLDISPTVIISALLGRIVPAVALRWLSENKVLFNYWIEFILNNEVSNNEIYQIISLAKSKLELPEFMHIQQESIKTDKTDIIDKFSHWLTESYKNYPDSVFRHENDLFIEEVVIENFAQENAIPSKDTLINEFANRNLLIENENSFIHELKPKNFEDRRSIKGILINDIPITNKLMNLPTNDYFIKSYTL